MTTQDRTFAQAGLWHDARIAYAAGRSARQIAHATGLLPSQISARANAENWPAPPPPDWAAMRKAWCNGEPASAIARRCGVSVFTVRKRCRRENWSRVQTSGLAALRRAVAALEQAMDGCDDADPVSLSRLAAALSMAAGRLSRVEKSRDGGGDDKDASAGAPGAEDEAMRAQISTLLMRLAGEEEEA